MVPGRRTHTGTMARPRIRTDRPSPTTYIIENGHVRLEFDLRTEFPWFNTLWLFDAARGDYRRFCHFGVEAMPAPPPPPPGIIDPPPYNVWLMGHRYTVKELQLSARRAQIRAAYPPPMVVVGELSQLARGAKGLQTFPDWPDEYWNHVDTMPCSIQAFWSMEAGQPWIELEMKGVLGELLAIMPMLHHGFAGHSDIPHHCFAGGRFLSARAPDGSWPSHFELFEDTNATRAQLDYANEQVFVFFGSEPESTAVAIALSEPHPEGFFFLGRNESAVDPANPGGFFAEAAKRAPWRPDVIHTKGFNEQTMFFEVPRKGRMPRLRMAFYPNSPLPYGDADALRAFIAAHPELTSFEGSAPAAAETPTAEPQEPQA
jgi:hypothetical protein